GTEREPREAGANDLLALELFANPGIEEGAGNTADAKGAEHDAVGERSALENIARDDRQERQDRPRRDTEQEAAEQDLLEVGRHRHIPEASGDRAPQRFARERVLRIFGLPAQENVDQR